MKRSAKTFKVEFLKSAPEPLSEDTLYISIEYSMALHLCPCGCKTEITTKISPKRWRLIYDGETVSLYPSIGNWNLPCRSHYWISKNKIEWAGDWPDWKIKRVQQKKMKDLGKMSDDEKISEV
jgi:hypothetical protein